MNFETESFLKSRAKSAKLKSPQFDDERTLLSARRVVPLDKVASKRQLRRNLTIILWIFVAFVVAGSGLIYFWPYNRTQAQRVLVAPPQAPPESDPAKTALAVETAISPPASNDSEVNQPPKLHSISSDIKRSSSAVVSGVDKSVPADRSSQPIAVNRADQFDNRPRRVWEREETVPDDEDQYLDNRTRRQLHREARRRERRGEPHSRDRDELFRIRDIFEGPQRP
jgi:hypothetical protein